jgi:hypothetical protein
VREIFQRTVAILIQAHPFSLVMLTQATPLSFVILTQAERGGRISNGGASRSSHRRPLAAIPGGASGAMWSQSKSRGDLTFRDPSAALRWRQDDKSGPIL